MTSSVNPMDIGQSDYMKLFMQELMYQDPLKPVDNREFMAQMAQFSLVQQATTTSEKTNELLLVSYDNQLINLLGKQIKIPDQLNYVQVESLNLEEGHIKSVKVRTEENQRMDITREQITEVLAE